MEGTTVETVTFLIAGAIVLAGGFGVILSRNPVNAALSLVATLFGVAVLFLNLDAQLLAAVQVIVYTGAIVVLILFVMMLLGVDKREEVFGDEPLPGQRIVAVLGGLSFVGVLLAVLLLGQDGAITGVSSTLAAIATDEPNINQLGKLLFTDYVFALEVTAALLTIAVVGAVVLARRTADYQPIPEPETFDLPPLEDLEPSGEGGAH